MDVLRKIQKFYSKWYLRYLLATEMYMIEPWERTAIYMFFALLFIGFGYFNYTFVANSVSHFRGLKY